LFDKTASLLERFDINFYIDLIFGLPKDNMESFARSFNQVAAINPAFIMLFPLSLIKGTELADQYAQYGILPYPREKIKPLNLMCDISYENIGLYRDFSEKDLETFDAVTLTVFYFYNRFYFSLSHLVKRCSQTPFALFRHIGEKTKKYLKESGLRASNTSQMQGFNEVLFALFSDILCRENAAENELKAFKELFNIDILRIILLTSPLRIKIFRSLADKKPDRAPASFSFPDDRFRAQRSSHGKIVNIPYALQDLFNLHAIPDTIARIPTQLFIHAPFNAWNVKIVQISPLERFCIEYIPANRGVRVNTIVQAATRQFRPAPRESLTITPESVQKTLQSLFEREIILLY
jgi:hypothetical protein